MRLLHTADLHIGKRLYGFSLIEDQEFILNELAALTVERNIDAVIIAGDVFDKAVPSEIAVELLDGFLLSLHEAGAAVFMIAGNHDSKRRLEYLSSLLHNSRVYIVGGFDGKLKTIRMHDEYGNVDFTLLPYMRTHDASCFTEEQIKSEQDAVKYALGTLKLDDNARNVLIAHQLVVSGSHTPWFSDSEEGTLGGIETVDAGLFAEFDYVALGHLHGAQSVGANAHVRYAGAPLKYAFGEVNHKKTATIIELFKKGDVNISMAELTPKRDLIRVKGPIEELLKGEADCGAYIEATLTDEHESPNAYLRLREVYKSLMHVKVDNSRTRAIARDIGAISMPENISVLDHFAAFYEQMNGRELSCQSLKILREVLNADMEVSDN